MKEVSPPPVPQHIPQTTIPINSHQLPQLPSIKKPKKTINHLSKMDCQTPRTRRRLSTSSIADPTPTDLDSRLDMEPNLRMFEHLNLSTSPSEITDQSSQSPTTASGNPGQDSIVPISDPAVLHLNQALRRMLSLHSEIPNSPSSAAERHAKAQTGAAKPFRKIGAGACGAVFAQDGRGFVVKLAKSDDHLELWNDYLKHTTIAAKFQHYIVNNDVRIPACHYFVPKDRTSWFDHYHGLGTAAEQICNLPTAALVTERIIPLPLPTRTKLVRKYCDERIKEKALADPANQDCLVRVYLGSMQGKSGQALFSLRNLKLHLNQMSGLQLNIEAVAQGMGKALAVMHWAAKTDARDVEFVLGSSSKKAPMALNPKQLELLPPYTYTGPETDKHGDLFRRTTELFVLDFNQVRSITMDDAGVAMAVEALCLNDPYYPKPLRTSEVERQVWKAFVVGYLRASEDILVGEEGVGSEFLSLPRKFIRGVKEVEREKMWQRARLES